MVLVALAFHSAKAAIGPCTGIAGGQGDPHLYSAHGGHADFRGQDKAFFNFLSHEKISANIKTEDGVTPTRARSDTCMCPYVGGPVPGQKSLEIIRRLYP